MHGRQGNPVAWLCVRFVGTRGRYRWWGGWALRECKNPRQNLSPVTYTAAYIPLFIPNVDSPFTHGCVQRGFIKKQQQQQQHSMDDAPKQGKEFNFLPERGRHWEVPFLPLTRRLLLRAKDNRISRGRLVGLLVYLDLMLEYSEDFVVYLNLSRLYMFGMSF